MAVVKTFKSVSLQPSFILADALLICRDFSLVTNVLILGRFEKKAKCECYVEICILCDLAPPTVLR